MKFYIKEAREHIGLTQKQLALELGVKPTTFNGYETGTHDPRSELLVQIARRCNTTVDFLLGLENISDENEIEPPTISDETESDPRFKVLKKNYSQMNENGKIALVQQSEMMVLSGMYDEHSKIPDAKRA